MPMYPASDHNEPSTATPEPNTMLGGKDPKTSQQPTKSSMYPNSEHQPDSSSADSDARPPSATERKPSPGGSAEDDPNDMHTPDAVRELRQSQTFDPNETYADELPDDVLTNDELTPELREAATREFRQMAADISLPPAELESFVGLARWAESNPPDDATQDTWRQEALAALEREFDDPAQALKDANALLRRDPRVRALINHFKLGSHPSVVKMIAQRARAEKAKGRL